MSDDHTTKLDAHLLPLIRDRAQDLMDRAEERDNLPWAWEYSGICGPDSLVDAHGVRILDRSCVDCGGGEAGPWEDERYLLEAANAAPELCQAVIDLTKRLHALVEKAQAVVDSEGNSHEDDSGGSFHYMVEVGESALHELQAALEEVSA